MADDNKDEALLPEVESLTRRLRRMEEVHSLLFDHANDAIFVHSMTPEGVPGRFEQVNETACQRLGYSREELLRLSPLDIDDPESARARAGIVEGLAANPSATFEMVHRTKDGRKLPVEICSRLLHLNGRRMVLSIARDISARKEMEQFLRERVKELTCLYGISRLIEEKHSWPEVLQGVANLIPQAWQHPEITRARIAVDGQAFQSTGGGSGDWTEGGHASLKQEIRVGDRVAGEVEVRCVGKWPEPDQGAFLDEERELLHAIAERLGREAERIHAQSVLHESEEGHRATLNSIGDAVIATDIDGRVVKMNPVAQQLTGWSLEDATGRPLEEVFRIVNACAQEPVETPVAKVLETGQVVGLANHTVLVDRGGQRRQIADSAAPIYNDRGEATGVVLVFRDVTASYEAAEALRRSEEKFSKAFQTSPYVITITRAEDGKFLDVNDTFTAVAGYTREEALAHSAIGLDLWVNLKDRERVVAKLLATGSVEAHEFQYRRKSGEEFTALFSARVITLDGETCVLSSINDITERVRSREEKARLEEQLWQAQKVEAIGRLAGGVAHDFNNMLSVVLGYGERLLAQLRPADPLRKEAQQIVEAGRRSAALTRQLLAFSRRQKLQPVALDLNALLLDMETMVRRMVGESISLELAFGQGLPPVLADPGQIEQVIMNLVVNSRDAMPHGGRLTISTAVRALGRAQIPDDPDFVPGEYVMLAVTDTGCGMDEETLAQAFEPFFTTKKSGEGTGLGLSTVYGIVKQSGGLIRAESAPGQGATIRIYLPQTKAEPESPEEDGEIEELKGHGEHILLVEDEASLRDLFEKMLASLGYQVTTAANGGEALLLVDDCGLKPGLVITDVVMPGMNGSVLAARLRSTYPELNVLYMSGYSDNVIASQGMLDPGVPLIEKPFTLQELARRVNEMLEAVRPERRRPAVVLMIDDDTQYRELAQWFCEKGGHRFAGTDSAAGAIEALTARPADVLLVDMNIPGTDGARVLREIRSAGFAMPAVVMTGDAFTVGLDALRPLGVARVLEKPSEAGPLLRAIEELGIGEAG